MKRVSLLVACPSFLSWTAAGQEPVRRYTEACDAGQASACAILGLMYGRGAGVERDLERAAEAYERACEGGEPRGCVNLGQLHASGPGVERDVGRARNLYGRACDAGERLGCDLLDALERTAGPRLFFEAGRVEDEANGRGLAEALVEVPDLGIRVLSDAMGRVALGWLPEGSHTLVVQRFGYEVVGGIIDVPGGAELIVRMPRAELTDPTDPGEIQGGCSERKAEIRCPTSRSAWGTAPCGR